jgi:hypothetical protein
LFAGCGPTYASRELPEWVAGPFHEADDQGFRIIPLRSFLIEDYSSADKGDDYGGTLIYALLNPDGVGELDVDIDAVTLLTGQGDSLKPESHTTLHRSERVVVGGIGLPPLPSGAERLDVEITRLVASDGAALEGRWLVEEVLMRWGNVRETDLTFAARMEFAHLTRDGGVYREGNITIGSDIHELIVGIHGPIGRPLIWVADPDVQFVPFHLDSRTPVRGWDPILEHMPE